jgi:probable rRNA maturation factor
MPVDLIVDPDIEGPALPDGARLDEWLVSLQAVVRDARLDRDVCVRICPASVSRELNRTYRGKDAPTNVLSFPADVELPGDEAPLGDLAICWDVVCREAAEQEKSVEAHLAHLTVHGLLHLLGHDHEAVDEAVAMEQIEIETLARLGIANPYEP